MATDRFVLSIDLGNEGMQTRDDVADALEVVVSKLRGGREGGFVVDVNGNTTGKWDLR